jgi:hypothetical protein
MISILCDELERSEGLPENSAKHLADMREGKLGPGLSAAIRAMQRVELECIRDHPVP